MGGPRLTVDADADARNSDSESLSSEETDSQPEEEDPPDWAEGEPEREEEALQAVADKAEKRDRRRGRASRRRMPQTAGMELAKKHARRERMEKKAKKCFRHEGWDWDMPLLQESILVGRGPPESIRVSKSPGAS